MPSKSFAADTGLKGYSTCNAETAYASVSLTNLNSSAYVTVYGINGVNQTIVLRDSNNKLLWLGDFEGRTERTLYLGNDHSVYRIYITTTTPSTVGSVSFTAKSNCSIDLVFPIRNFQQQWITGSNPYFIPDQWGVFWWLSEWACGDAAVATAISTFDPYITPQKICNANYQYAGNDGSAMQAWNDLGYAHYRSATIGSTDDIDGMLANYNSDPAHYTPPIMYLIPRHFIVVVGQNSTQYFVYDPGYPELRTLQKPANYTQVDQFKR